MIATLWNGVETRFALTVVSPLCHGLPTMPPLSWSSMRMFTCASWVPLLTTFVMTGKFEVVVKRMREERNPLAAGGRCW